MNVVEVKGKVNNKKVEVKKIIGGKKIVKKNGRYVATWTCGVCDQILNKTAVKMFCEGCMKWCHLNICLGLKDRGEHNDTFRGLGCKEKINTK